MHNLVPSELAAVVGVIDPDVYANGTLVTGWVKADKYESYMGVVVIGALGVDATLIASLQCATSSGGAGVKAVSAAKTSATLTQAGTDYSDKQVVITLRTEELDDGFNWIRLAAVTAGGVATSLVSGVLLGFDSRYGPASLNDAASVAAIVK